jgi:hypothetical protein
MKYFYSLLLLVSAASLSAQIVIIPDANFKSKLLAAEATNEIAKDLSGNYIKIDTNNNQEIEISEAAQVGSLLLWYSDIVSLSGINSFTNLEELNCCHNLLTSLDVSSLIHLRHLECYINQIPVLNVNNLVSLEYLSLNNNQVSNLEVGNLHLLRHLDFGSNNISSINVNGLTQLNFLAAQFNLLTTLDVSGLVNLTLLACYNNQLTSLDLTGLDLIDSLQIESNLITSLDLSNLTSLQSLYCANNLLTNLDVSTTSHLDLIDCQNNLLTQVNVKNGHAEETFLFAYNPNLLYICSDDDQTTDIQNAITENALTNCHVNTYCSFVPGGIFYTINGSNHVDYNSNGCDSNDRNYSNLKLAITDGTSSGNIISDSNGEFSLNLSNGTYTIVPVLENPDYFIVSPSSILVTFPDEASPFTQNFCITPSGSHQDIETWIVPVTTARPGFDARYQIFYKNKGNNPVSGNLTFTFEDNYMDFVSATPAQDSQTFSLLNWNYSNLLPYETRSIVLTLNINSPQENLAVNIGDLLKFWSTIYPIVGDEYSTDNSNDLRQVVVGSFDPNDKTCVEGTMIAPDMAGEYVHYVIRFENTGTANAENIVVKDLIDTAKFDINTLIPLSGSHTFETKINNTNQVEFVFEGIDLPFDDTNNDGYVAFKIKTKPTLVEGDTFSNTANIYFDYNFPIVTNMFTTTIQALGIPDFEFGSMFTLSPVPTKNLLTISIKQAVAMGSVSIYNTLGQLVRVITNPNETIDVSGLKAGSYFIKIISDKGTAVSTFVKE